MKSFCQYLMEVSKDQLSALHKHQKNRPFDNIFGDKIRIVIPLRKERSDYSFINHLSNLGYKVDLETGMATSKVETFKCDKCKRQIQLSEKPDFCPSCKNKEVESVPNSEKEKKERVGTVLSKLNRTNPNRGWGGMLSWWEKNKGKKAAEEGETGISIVISRSPIDIIRMSDHKEFDSCHSPKNSTNLPANSRWLHGPFFHCATQEARTGGAVAYAIHTSDLKHIKDLQANDIFKDRDRNVDGIEPLERQKIKRFSDGKIDLLIPEPKTYGIKHVDFKETILDWLKYVQRNIVDFSHPPKFKNFNLRGGSYQDVHPASILWNGLFGTSVHGEKSSIDQEEEHEGQKWTVDRLDQAAQATLDAHKQNWKHCWAWFEVEEADEDNEFFISSSGSVSFEFNKDLFLKIPDDDDLYIYRNNGNLGNTIAKVFNFSISNINIAEHNNKVNFHVDVEYEDQRDHVPQGVPRTLNDFEGLLDDLDTIEGDYDKLYNDLIDSLIDLKFIRNWREGWNFNHFKVERHKTSEVYVVSEEMWIGDLQGVQKNLITSGDYNYYKKNKKDQTIKFASKLEALNSNVCVIFPFNTINAKYLKFKTD
jgi:hypothetical protein